LARADAEALFALIARLKQQGQAVIYITHFIEEAKASPTASPSCATARPSAGA